ncbi:MAG: hypothetical protein Q7J21_10765 [Rugosibacter sp.]|nr:hypothetical protein [Rugosibacter sp.]
MIFYSIRWLFPAGLLLSIPLVYAQFDSEATTITSPALQYHSALEQYRKVNNQPVAAWRETIDTVGQIGGWRMYAKETQQPDPVETHAAPAKTGQGVKNDTPKNISGSHMNHGDRP